MKSNLDRLPKEPSDRFTHPFSQFLRIESAAGAVLLLCAVAALVFSNSQWSGPYMAFWDTATGFRWGNAEFSRSIKQWIIDGAMTLFFFVIALELKREIVLGELRNIRLAAFSIAAALGGMAVPAVLFALLEGNSAARHAWGVVMATDTAFVIGCLALLGSRIPPSLRLFLLSLAIFDDIGAILVIAIAYGSGINWLALGLAAFALFGIAMMRRAGIRHIAVYAVAGMAVWLALDVSGIHPTLAGMLLGVMTPARSWVNDGRLRAILGKVVSYPHGEHWSGDTEERRDLRRAGTAAREALSPLERIEISLHPWVAFAVLPLFALASAGLPLSHEEKDWRLVAAIVAGLFVGKPIGVVSFSYLATRAHFAIRPETLSWPLIVGGALLTGIGFTMSLLIAELALAEDSMVSAKLGILCASALSSVCGLAVLTWLSAKRQRLPDSETSLKGMR